MQMLRYTLKRMLNILPAFVFVSCTSANQDSNKTMMSYLVSIATPQDTAGDVSFEAKTERGLAILNITHGINMYGSTDETGSTELWVVPAPTKRKDELTEQLLSVKGISSVSVVTLSKPIKSVELNEVRKLYLNLGVDASKVSDDKLAMFIDDVLQQQYAYYMDYDFKKTRTSPVEVSIKRIEEHPHFSPEWLKHRSGKKEALPNWPLTMDDVETFTFTDTVILEDISGENEPEPEPPSPPPGNLDKMTDEQVSKWIHEKHLRKPKYEDIKITRTPQKVTVIIKFGSYTETFEYILKR